MGNPVVRWVLRIIAVGYVLGLVALPVGTVVQHTFENGLEPVLESLRNPDFQAAARLGVFVAVISVLINTVFGIGISILIVRYRFPGRRLLNAIIDLPVSISPIVVGIALIFVYGTNGWFGPVLNSMGIQIIFATPALVLATVIVALPLVVREVIPVLEEAGTEQDQAAQSLGANGFQRFVRITLPTIRWALAYGVVLSLARSLGEFGAVRVVSGSVAGVSQTPTLFVNDAYQEFGAQAEQDAFTAAFLLMCVAVLFIVVIALLRPKEQNQ
ncbi:sulfate ABC transporter permease subunit [Kineosporia sp. NBRC 101731]|uniref:sulfate ABC transporter permease n=1 Tax=Kineosporia sp. NBRC 101731 TaxID=3032199 RepID=UPI0024A19F40|nr:sulfate ABC transporter permease subunit [Kineosporia sp. NBRC 101731]GLY31216.1 sulfate ABC transporter permease subunit CysW [Kineosporia sp. NBRC 101731]